MTAEEIKKRRAELSAKVIYLAQGTLMLNMRYMSKAISRLPARPYEGTYACGGLTMDYDPVYLLERYKKNERLPVHDCLHMLLHCVFRHWHIGSGMDRLCWDTACDIAAESALMKTAGEYCANENLPEKAAALLELSAKVKPLTAEKLYAYFMSGDVSRGRIEGYGRVFGVDDHVSWYPEQPKELEDEETPPFISPDFSDDGERGDEGESSDEQGGGNDDENSAESSENSDNDGETSAGGAADKSLEQYLENERKERQEQLNDMWKELAREIKSELEDFGKDKGENSRYLVQLLERLDRERYDYGEFLRKFAVTGEIMHADLDSYEPAFYSYGLSLYGNVALIEPPEYKETKLVRDFVIAIDTSGSVSGKLVQSFMKKTYNILKSTESYFARVNIHIIQCDTEVREAVCINDLKELEKYMEKMELKGLGGTDFRPVFEYVDGLCRDGVLKGLKGMVYFTDGCGTFPEHKPKYDTVFAFIGESEAAVPPWAVKLELEDEDFADGR